MGRISLTQTLRSLGRARMFTLFAIAALALGLGANTAIFSVFRAVLLKPLPFGQPGSLVFVWEDASFTGFPGIIPAPANYLDWRKQNSVFSDMAASRSATAVLAGTPPEEIAGRRVTANFFDVLGVKAALGRTFIPSDDGVPPRVAVLTDALWRRRFAADPGIVGREIVLSGSNVQVVGVLPPGVRFPDRLVDFYMPIGMNAREWARRGSHFLQVVARLKPGITQQRAQTEMSAIAARLERDFPDTNSRLGAVVIPFRQQLAGNTRPLLWTLLAVSLTVLLISCANVANLLLTRAAGRQREQAIRLAIGAGAGDIFAQVMLEALLLALAGCLLGLGLAYASLKLLGDLVPIGMRGVFRPELDWPVALFSAAISLLCALGIGLLPALSMLRRQLTTVLQQGGRTGVSVRSRRVRDALVVAEVALSVVLVATGWLLVQRMIALRAEPLGFQAEQVLAARLRETNRGNTPSPGRQVFIDRTLEAVRALPGAKEAAFTFIPPFLSRGNSSGYVIEGKPLLPGVERDVLTRIGTGAYLRLMGARLKAGRLLNESDTAEAPRAIVINETFARQHFPGASALGRRIKVDETGDEAPWFTIVGVIEDMKERGYDNAPKITAYLSQPQTDWPMDWLVVRMQGDAKALIAPLQRVVQQIDPGQPVSLVQTLDAAVEDDLADSKQHQRLAVGFAGLAVLLAALGIFAVLSFQVTLRVREMGLRAALGAQPAQIGAMVLRHGLVMTGAGLVLGIAASESIARVLRSLLDRVSATPPTFYLGLALFFFLVGALAAFWPAWRAARVDPATVMREE